MSDGNSDHLLALTLHEEEQQNLLGVSECGSDAIQGRPTFDEDREEGRRLRTILSGWLPKASTRPSTACAVPSSPQRSADRERLLLRIDQYALYEFEVVGDGNCQFRAVADQLYRNEGFHRDVRGVAVERLRRFPDAYGPFVAEEEYGAYVARMARDGTWGDHVTLKALADHFGAEVCVLTSFREDPVLRIAPDTTKTQRTLWLSFWAEVHYNSLYPEKEPPVR